jgi:hypothetical protein
MSDVELREAYRRQVAALNKVRLEQLREAAAMTPDQRAAETLALSNAWLEQQIRSRSRGQETPRGTETGWDRWQRLGEAWRRRTHSKEV